MSDLERRFARGDDEAFSQAVERYSRQVYSLCYRMLRDQEEAKDMTQDVFVRVYSKRKSFKGKSTLYTWIYRIAANMCLSYLKKHKHRMVPLDEIDYRLAAEEDTGTERAADLDRHVKDAVLGLPPKQRAVFVMRFYDKMSFREIAEAMGISIGGAKANHHFAVEKLRNILSERDIR